MYIPIKKKDKNNNESPILENMLLLFMFIDMKFI